MFLGAGVGGGHHTLLTISAGLVAWDSDLRLVQCGMFRALRTPDKAVTARVACQLGEL